MKKDLLLLMLFFSISPLTVNAQRPEEILEQWSEYSPIEKLHLHFDRESYIAGETAWFKAYLSSDHFPGTASTTLHAELVNAQNHIISKKTFPILLGGAGGQVEIPDSLVSGMYIFKAYTPSMLRGSADFIFTKGIYINGKKKKEELTAQSNKTKLEFFPEGGSFIAGYINNIAFKATDRDGLPVKVKGKIRNNKNEEIISFSEYHDGMGVFELKALPGESYFATINGNETEKFALPEVTEKGIVISIIPHPQGHFFELKQKTIDPAFVAAYMVGQMQHHVVFRQELNKKSEAVQGVIRTEHLLSGILQVTFFNQDGIPLAERLCFVNNGEFLQPAELLLDTLNLTARGRNRFRLALQDTVQANISVSITDAAYDIPREANILTNLLLTSDLKGYVHNPVYYFSGYSDSVKTATDLLMMTHGWRRFKWTELAKGPPPPLKAPAYITLNGRATLKGTNRSFADKSLLLMISNLGERKGRSIHMLHTDKNGNFFVDSLMFFDKNHLVFSDVRGKKSQYIDITLSGDSLHRPLPHTGTFIIPERSSGNTVMREKWQADYDAILKANGLMLEGIIVKARTKSPAEQVDERYTTGIFSGDATRSIDLVNSDDADTYANIFDFLQFRVNGLRVVNEGLDYRLFYRQTESISSMGNIPMSLYLDEVETDAFMIATIPASQVALVKVYSNFIAAPGNAPGGVIAIYTKKGNDFTGSSGVANVSVYNGYSVIKEFYAPDHKTRPVNDKPDERITIDWRHTIFVNSIDPRIPLSFYNNDRTRQFKVVVEGMTSSGKLIWLEKLVSGDQ